MFSNNEHLFVSHVGLREKGGFHFLEWIIYIYNFWNLHMARGWHVEYPETYLEQYDNLVPKFCTAWHIDLFVMFLGIPSIEITS